MTESFSRANPPGPMAQFARGFGAPLRAANLLIQTRRLKRYAVLPLIANVVIYVLFLALVAYLLINWNPQVSDWTFWGPVGGWLSTAINWAIGPLKWLVAAPVVLFFCYFSFTIIGFIIAAPFNDMLSERVERAICEPKKDLSLPLRTTGKLMVLSMIDALGILARQLLWTVLVLPLLFLPLVGFAPLFLVIAYFTGLGLFDTSMARNNLRYRHKQPVIRVHRWEMLGLGVAMELLFLVPFLGLLMLPLGVTSGTILYCGIDWERALREAGLEQPVGFRPPVPKHEA